MAALGALAAHAGAERAYAAGTGGAHAVPIPRIASVACVADCASKRRVRAGSKIRLRGRNLRGVTRVVFIGGPRRSDDVAVDARTRFDRRLDVRVPETAHSGPLRAFAGDRTRSLRTRAIRILPPPPPPPLTANPTLTPVPGPRDPGAPQLETAISSPRAYLEGRAVKLSYRVSDDGPVDVQIDLMRTDTGGVAETWTRTAAPGQVESVNFTGVTGGGVAPEGRYAFRIAARDQGGALAHSAQSQDVQRDAFDLYHHIFPVRGRHNFGQAGARFGSGRAGHSHQGHDVFARCGTRLVAARGGVVKFRQYHAAAGHYIVIDGGRTGIDYAYMHLVNASPFKPGQRVETGQQIGLVGDSGNARGCHLHFEMWGAPGWYDGGRPFDPLPSLLAWDRFS